MSDIYKDGDDNLIVDFSTENRGSKMAKDKSARTDYDGIDLASGYPSDQIWTTGDGRRIAIPNMTSDHLLNVIMFMRSRAPRYKMQVAIRSLMTYTGQKMMFDDEFDIPSEVIESKSEEFSRKVDVLHKEPTDDFLRIIFPIYSKLFMEAYKRKLTIPSWTEPTPPKVKSKGKEKVQSGG